MVVTAAIVAYLIIGKGCEGKEKKEKKTLTLEQLQRYKVGDFYRTIINTNVHGPIEGGDWGLVGAGSLLYQGEFDILREVQAKGPDDRGMDPNTDVKIALEVRRARDLAVAVELEDVQMEVPPMVGNVLIYGASAVAGLQSGPIGSAISLTVSSVTSATSVNGCNSDSCCGVSTRGSSITICGSSTIVASSANSF